MSFARYEFIIKKMAVIMLALGIILHIMPYLVEHSLFIDEAMVASTIMTRDLGNLVLSPMDYGQSAPIGYLYIVKLCTLVFGVSKVSLRIWSLICLFGTCGLMYYILDKLYHVRRAAYFTAIFSLLPFYISYSSQVKQYTSECMFVLAVVILFWYYFHARISLWWLCVMCSIVIWFSFAPVFFIVGGMLLVIKDILQNKRFLDLIHCLLPALSFAVYYFFWLAGTEGNAGAKGFWALLAFPLIPSSLDDIILILKMVKQSVGPQLKHMCVLYLLAAGYTLYSWRKDRNHKASFYIFGLVILLVASAMGYYPIAARLMSFFAVLVLILASVSLDEYWHRLELKWQYSRKKLAVLMSLATILLILPLGYTAKEMVRGNLIFWHETEIVQNLAYLEKNKKPSDMIYVYWGAQPSYFFEKGFPYGGPNNWEMAKIGTITDEYIWGKKLNEFYYRKPYSYDGHPREDNIQHDIENIKRYDSVYLFTSHMNGEKDVYWQLFLNELKAYGDIEIVSVDHDTYLYHFQRRV